MNCARILASEAKVVESKFDDSFRVVDICLGRRSDF